MKNIINTIKAIYSLNPFVNNLIIGAIIIIIVGCIVYAIFNKEKAKIVAKIISKMIRTELTNNLSGPEKFEKVYEWVINQNFYKTSFLRFLNFKKIKNFIQKVFDENKEDIEKIKK